MPTSPNEDGRPTAGGAAQPVHIMNPGAISGGGGGGGGSQSVTVVELPDATPTSDGEANPNTTRVGSLNYGYNNTTWDRLRTVAGDAMAAIGLQAMANMLWNGATYDRTQSTTPSTATKTTGVLAVGLYALNATQAALSPVQIVLHNNDGASGNYSHLLTVNRPELFDGSSAYDRARNNYEATVLASAARTTSTNSTDQVNYNARGINLVFDITAVPGIETLTLTIQGKSTLSGKYYTILAGAVQVGVATVVMRVYPGLVAAGNLDANAVLPRIWRASIVASGSGSFTYSVDANYVL